MNFKEIFRFLLIVLEPAYRVGFFFVIFFKKLTGGVRGFPFKVISVGNLSVGGTGKTPLGLFLLKKLSLQYGVPLRGAVVMRGYKRVGQSLGDEGELYQEQGALVKVGANRAQSCRELAGLVERGEKKIDFVLLDDAYQNFQVKKDFEILLLDARRPFENGHCLPAGRLREKDFTRADVIILTHADEVAPGVLEPVIKKLGKKFPRDQIFLGKHAADGIFSCEQNRYLAPQEIREKKFIALAGIGSPDGFQVSLEKAGVSVLDLLSYPDHHQYIKKDIAGAMVRARTFQAASIITTRKDWMRLRDLVGETVPDFYILDVGFQFLTQSDEDRFLGGLKMVLV
ncbi:tetraacyldisaccharide 4'-kinase [Candidatus Babeliales bacterium]|nr:tetraacyldisaccharide 4'-kinase [Candidatus Babeliales bacterium]